MSDIFNPPKEPDYHDAECPDCGRLRGIPCAGKITCGARRTLIHSILGIQYLQLDPTKEMALHTSYAHGWNDAIEAIVERLRGNGPTRKDPSPDNPDDL